jgi:REP element-mobilizing transposase RayT
MAWPLRMFQPTGIYFVTVRCFQGRLLLRPSNQTNAVLSGVLARAARLSCAELFGFVFASNHFHLIVRAPKGNLPRFMQFLLSNISKKVGWLVDWRGAFWERRYSAEPVLDDDALLGRLRYVLAHGVKEGLVRRCEDWPGLSSLSMVLGPSTRSVKWFNWTRRWRDRTQMDARRFSDEWAEPEQLTLSPLPSFVRRPAPESRVFWREAVAAIEKEASLNWKSVLGVKAVLSQDPQHRPPRPARRPRPLCHTISLELRRLFREHYHQFVALFRKASPRWLLGNLRAPFPEGAFRPFLWPDPLRAIAA